MCRGLLSVVLVFDLRRALAYRPVHDVTTYNICIHCVLIA
jgi:hypothetical protein